jgi:hypothetical protein
LIQEKIRVRIIGGAHGDAGLEDLADFQRQPLAACFLVLRITFERTNDGFAHLCCLNGGNNPRYNASQHH